MTRKEKGQKPRNLKRRSGQNRGGAWSQEDEKDEVSKKGNGREERNRNELGRRQAEFWENGEKHGKEEGGTNDTERRGELEEEREL